MLDDVCWKLRPSRQRCAKQLIVYKSESVAHVGHSPQDFEHRFVTRGGPRLSHGFLELQLRSRVLGEQYIFNVRVRLEIIGHVTLVCIDLNGQTFEQVKGITELALLSELVITDASGPGRAVLANLSLASEKVFHH